MGSSCGDDSSDLVSLISSLELSSDLGASWDEVSSVLVSLASSFGVSSVTGVSDLFSSVLTSEISSASSIVDTNWLSSYDRPSVLSAILAFYQTNLLDNII